MSLLLTSCHGYAASGLSGITTSTTQIALASWVWVPASITDPGLGWRSLIMLSGNPINSVQDYMACMASDGSYLPGARVRISNSIGNYTGGPTMYDSAHTGRWLLVAAIYDQPATNADLFGVYGRPAATAIPATETAKSANLTLFSQALTELFVGRDVRYAQDASTANDSTSAIEIGETAIWVGSIPTLSQWQAMVDGASPDSYSPWEHWRFRNSSDGLVGRIRGITLAPVGGSATAAYNAARNPTVADPAGGGAATASGVTLTATASLIAGAATGVRNGTAAGQTLTATASLIAGSASAVATGTLALSAAGNEFIARTGSAINTFAREIGVDLHLVGHADGLTLGSPIYTSGSLTTDSNGRLPNVTSALLTPGATVKVVPTRQSDGVSGFPRRMVVS